MDILSTVPGMEPQEILVPSLSAKHVGKIPLETITELASGQSQRTGVAGQFCPVHRQATVTLVCPDGPGVALLSVAGDEGEIVHHRYTLRPLGSPGYESHTRPPVMNRGQQTLSQAHGQKLAWCLRLVGAT